MIDTISGKHIALTCSADAIVPNWAYAADCKSGSLRKNSDIWKPETLETLLFEQAISALDFEQFRDGRSNKVVAILRYRLHVCS